jgi:uncharacterized protein YcaQ
VRITAEAARRFLVARHALAPARSLEGGPDAVLEIFRRWGSIQFDPLAVAGRNHDLVLHARVAEYDPPGATFSTSAARSSRRTTRGSRSSLRRSSVVPRDREQARVRVLADNADVAGRVLERIRSGRPVVVARLRERERVATDWFGAPTNTVRAVLEAYAVTGELGLARREGNRRYYDLIERLLPADLLAREIPLREQLRHKLLSRYRAHGLLGVAGPDIFGGLGPARPDPKWPGYPGRSALREELVSSGELVRSTSRRARQEVRARRRGRPARAPAGAAALRRLPAPVRPVVWDRGLLGSLFEFEYVWELFVPPAKRRWGWYVLPMLFGERLVGRIEPRIDRAGARVEVLGLWWEDGFAPRRAEGFVDAMRDALRAYLRFASATRIAWAPQLGTEKRLFLTR